MTLEISSSGARARSPHALRKLRGICAARQLLPDAKDLWALSSTRGEAHAAHHHAILHDTEIPFLPSLPADNQAQDEHAACVCSGNATARAGHLRLGAAAQVETRCASALRVQPSPPSPGIARTLSLTDPPCASRARITDSSVVACVFCSQHTSAVYVTLSGPPHDTSCVRFLKPSICFLKCLDFRI
jgi:hypothetical protein